MSADWMPPLPEPDVIVHYTADKMRQAQADAARAALGQAALLCDEFQRQHGDSDNHGKVIALRIRALTREITP